MNKKRVHIQPNGDLYLESHQKLSYAVFYVVGPPSDIKYVFSRHTTGFDGKLINELLSANIKITVKSGTLGQRKNSRKEISKTPLRLRLKEIRSELYKCSVGKKSAISVSTRLVYDQLTANGSHHCYMFIFPYKKYESNDTMAMENEVAKRVMKLYGLSVCNTLSVFNPRNMDKWGSDTLKFKA